MSQLSSLCFRPYYGSLSFSVNRTPSFCRFNLPFRCPTTRAMASRSQIVGYPCIGPERAQVCFGIILGVDIDLVNFAFFSYESSVILMANFSKANESKCKAHKMSYRTIEATCLAVNMVLFVSLESTFISY
ncbi:uncharacterized protein LOC133713121 [Rosa rugosa]|uniref:uncharacterized protein LOC133713121 n=1 Tax=Rosa rugosa TaxID=74645 RepID=UPI002B403DC2|nr:uncharacterized protein LOC133713121 [Rosa rugosa]XP_061995223.1 uncharacterized protein LOC133713121 [Rosa rugosa]XP_061995224.1 uncharacterized protein LOC133713121 [Rosa rugosa]